MITITGAGDHDQPDWLITMTGIRNLPSDRTNAAAAQAAHAASTGWAQKYWTLNSWFEAGERVEQLLRPLRTHKQRVAAVSTELLPARRLFWAERCAWMAATLRESADLDGEDWIDFALVARDLAEDRPLAGIPLAGRIATATVDLFVQR